MAKLHEAFAPEGTVFTHRANEFEVLPTSTRQANLPDEFVNLATLQANLPPEMIHAPVHGIVSYQQNADDNRLSAIDSGERVLNSAGYVVEARARGFSARELYHLLTENGATLFNIMSRENSGTLRWYPSDDNNGFSKNQYDQFYIHSIDNPELLPYDSTEINILAPKEIYTRQDDYSLLMDNTVEEGHTVVNLKTKRTGVYLSANLGWFWQGEAEALERQNKDEELQDQIDNIESGLALGGGTVYFVNGEGIGGAFAATETKGIAINRAKVTDTDNIRLGLFSTNQHIRLTRSSDAPIEVELSQTTNGNFEGTVEIALEASGDTIVKAEALNQEGVAGVAVDIALEKATPPTVIAAQLSGNYPIIPASAFFPEITLASLPANNASFVLQVETDQPVTKATILNQGAAQTYVYNLPTPSTSFTVPITIANRGDIVQALPVVFNVTNEFNAVSNDHSTDSSGSVNGVNVLNIGNAKPGGSITKTLPTNQTAIKDLEEASLVLATTNATSAHWSSPNIQLEILSSDLSGATVRRAQASSGYTAENMVVNNLSVLLRNDSNGLTTIVQTVIPISQEAPPVTVNVPAMPSSEAGTTYNVTLSSPQRIASATINGDDKLGSVFITPVSYPGVTSARRTMQVKDQDLKGDGTITGVATGPSGLDTTYSKGYSTKGLVGRTLNKVQGPGNPLAWGVNKEYVVVKAYITDVNDISGTFDKNTEAIVPVAAGTPHSTYVNGGLQLVYATQDYQGEAVAGLNGESFVLKDGDGNALANHPVSVLYWHDIPEHGMSLNYDILNFAETGKTV